MAKVNQYRVNVWLILFCVLALNSKAQTCRLTVFNSSGNTAVKDISIPSTFINKNDCIAFVYRLPDYLISKGWLGASVDSVWEDSAQVNVKLFTGNKYDWKSIEFEKKTGTNLMALGYSQNILERAAFNPETIADLYKELLNYQSNNGHPFAKVYFDSLHLDSSGKLCGKINVNEGPLYYIDTIIVEGAPILSKKFLVKYLGFKEGDIYQQNKLDAINSRLQLLPYLQQKQPWSQELLNTGAVIHLYPEALRSNAINILVGLLPDNNQTGGKLLLTGDAKVDLRNSFKTGETIGLNWQQLQPRSPHLNLLYNQPYIFSSLLGFNFNFDLYKRDSAFLSIQSQSALQYTIAPDQTVAVLLQTVTSSMLSIDTASIRQTKKLPENIDVNSVGLGLQYNFSNTNYRFNPRKGNDIQISGTFGSRKIKKNTTITQIKDPLFNYNSLYDSVALNSYQFRLQATMAHYIPAGKQSAIKLSLNSGWYQSPSYFQNELFRIGGFKLLRGFDEESIFTNLFSIATAEYRYLLARNSYLFGFTDGGKIRLVNSTNSYITTFIGFGAGLVFETPSGIFNLSYAAGKQGFNSIDLRQSKIHLGFVSLF